MEAGKFSGLVLAAGKGTRMKSELPKCLHKVCGVPMVSMALRALAEAGSDSNCVVVGHGGQELIDGISEPAAAVWQTEQLGTGHAVQMAKSWLEGLTGPVVILPGDAPLIKGASIQRLVSAWQESGKASAIATVQMGNPFGYGRIIRDQKGDLKEIVEEKDANPSEKKVNEVSVSVYCIDSKLLLDALPKLNNKNAQGEFYLVDVLKIFVEEGHGVEVVSFDDADEFSGVNDRWQLASAQTALQTRILRKLAESGVTLINWPTISVDLDCKIDPNTVLGPGAIVEGKSRIGSGSRIGPWCTVSDSVVGEESKVSLSHLVRCQVGDRVTIGPFANIRPHSVIENDCKIGNFVEVKNSHVHRHVSASHLSYLGDAEIGENTNIGAGTILCNYNGFSKSKTVIGKGVFVGSNSTLVAPISVGDGAMVAAGSVVTVDVPEQSAAFGRARTEIKEKWAVEWRQRMKERHEELKRAAVETLSEPTGKKS